MEFPAYQVEVTPDNHLKVIVHYIDETDIIYDDPEARDIIRASKIFSEDEMNESIIKEPLPMTMGEDIHIHGRLVVDALCRTYLQIHPDAGNRAAIEQLWKRKPAEVVRPLEEPDISNLGSGDVCILEDWEDVEAFVHWVAFHAPY